MRASGRRREAVTAVLEALVAGKTDGGLVQYLVENLNTVLVPVNNVDGFIQTQLYPARSQPTRAAARGPHAPQEPAQSRD